MVSVQEKRLSLYFLSGITFVFAPIMLFGTDIHTKAAGGIDSEQTRQFAAFINKVDQLLTQETAANAAIDWGKPNPDFSESTHIHEEITAAFRTAVQNAGENADDWLQIARRAPKVRSDDDTCIRYAEKALSLKASAENYVLLGAALRSKYGRYIYSKNDSDRAGLQRATEALSSAVHLSGAKRPDILYELGECFLDQYRVEEAETEYLIASRLVKPDGDRGLRKDIDAGLIMTAYLSKNKDLMKARFERYTEAGFAQRSDWSQEAWHLRDIRAYSESGEAYLQAASKFDDYSFVCQATDSFYFGNDLDRALSSARDCIRQGEGRDKSAATIATARARIADISNQRGVSEEALSQINQALVINPNDALFLDTKAKALYNVGRYSESATVSRNAVQASDGKYGWMHFQLGLAYFKLRDWQAAEDSFERAASLDPKDAVAAYNVAASYQNMQSRRNAIAWYKQVIARDPAYAEKNDVVGCIADLERQLHER